MLLRGLLSLSLLRSSWVSSIAVAGLPVTARLDGLPEGLFSELGAEIRLTWLAPNHRVRKEWD